MNAMSSCHSFFSLSTFLLTASFRSADACEEVKASGASRGKAQLNVDDVVIDEATETVERCPAGYEPIRSEHGPDSSKTRTETPADRFLQDRDE